MQRIDRFLTIANEAGGQSSGDDRGADAGWASRSVRIWQASTPPGWDLEPHLAQPDVPAGIGVIDGNQIPYRADALAKTKDNYKNRAPWTRTANASCRVPRVMYLRFRFQIVQTATQVTMLFEYAHAFVTFS